MRLFNDKKTIVPRQHNTGFGVSNANQVCVHGTLLSGLSYTCVIRN